MEVGAVPYNVFPSIGYAINASQSGRMSVPVSPSSYIYSHFRHISGVPAPEGVDGVSINRLKIIDTLIEQISRMKQEPEPFSAEGVEQDWETRSNAMIEQYHNQVRNIQTANYGNPYAPASPHIGAIFSITI